MQTFLSYLSEDVKHEGGIAHIEHPSDRTFDGEDAAHHALKTLRGVLTGNAKLTRKIDDKMSFHAMRNPDGSVAVKYKGSGARYNHSHEDIDKQHGDKPYLAGPLHALLEHLGKVLPKEPGEYQGGFMSTPQTRDVTPAGEITHTPNTIEYRAAKNSPEGQKLMKSKVSAVIHSRLVGANRTAEPITDTSDFQSHPDVHLVQHTVEPEHMLMSPKEKQQAKMHVDAANELMHGHTWDHLNGHEKHLRTYINKTVDSGDTPNVTDYIKHLQAVHGKLIDKVKTQKAKDAKTITMEADIGHVLNNRKEFAKTFDIHHHMQQATNILARNLDRHGAGGFTTHIGGKAAGGEGYVSNGLKIVDREGFSKANRERSAILRASRNAK
jgi:hypothetical protein